ncbi:hypothetical protein AAF712_015615 [Marasmius tenuissimus]|uniref:DDE Tnp4 domain-containing protein n=1 Tax=Marasmius tenuissimus TaxID=585030 RepID=A0ABR2Z809_9AGAR
MSSTSASSLSSDSASSTSSDESSEDFSNQSNSSDSSTDSSTESEEGLPHTPDYHPKRRLPKLRISPLKGDRLRNSVLREIRQLHSKRYFVSHKANNIPQGPEYLSYTFLKFVEILEQDPVFQNDARNAQMPVKQQAAIFLYCLGHSGNVAGLQKVADWAGVGKGTVVLVTKRVMKAVLRDDFRTRYVCMPTEVEKEEAKAWVEAHSCEGWQDGWCLVDGTLILLFDRPHWYGESYFDRKCNYSLNVQVVSLPNLQIVDFGYGFT